MMSTAQLHSTAYAITIKAKVMHHSADDATCDQIMPYLISTAVPARNSL